MKIVFSRSRYGYSQSFNTSRNDSTIGKECPTREIYRYSISKGVFVRYISLLAASPIEFRVFASCSSIAASIRRRLTLLLVVATVTLSIASFTLVYYFLFIASFIYSCS